MSSMESEVDAVLTFFFVVVSGHRGNQTAGDPAAAI